MQASDWRDIEGTSHVIQLLLAGAPEDRPDALIVVDDNLIEGTIAGLIAAGIRMPHDLDAVARVNFPLPVEPALPFQLLGYDLRNALQQAILLIDEQLNQGTPTPGTAIPPMWQENLTGPHHPGSSAFNSTLVQPREPSRQWVQQ